MTSRLGLEPDLVTLSKHLGGGLAFWAKIQILGLGRITQEHRLGDILANPPHERDLPVDDVFCDDDCLTKHRS
jgi:hypothetical protein